MPSAFITGASSGFGAVFARQLAGRGYDLLLAARRSERLQALQAELQAQYPGIQVKLLVADLATLEGIQQAVAALTALPGLEVLVNNAGFSTLGRYHKVPAERHTQMLLVHLQAAMQLSHAALPGMLARRRGAIINVASLAAFVGLPGGANYNATKAALVGFSRGLAAELRNTGVHVQALCPGFTITEFHETPEYQAAGFSRRVLPGIAWGPAEPVVQRSLQRMWTSQVVVTYGWLNQLILFFIRNALFDPFVRLAVRLIFKH